MSTSLWHYRKGWGKVFRIYPLVTMNNTRFHDNPTVVAKIFQS